MRTQHKFKAEMALMPDQKSTGSRLEREWFARLVLHRKAGDITGFECQDSVVLAEGNGEIIKWKVDFKVFLPNGQEFHIETKGKEMADYRLKRKLWVINDIGPLLVLKGKIVGGQYSYCADEKHSYRMDEIDFPYK
jgi:hypothetical protein